MPRSDPFRFGTGSRRELATCHPDLGTIADIVIQIYDFRVAQGRRTIEAQIANILRGVSKTIDSHHIPRDAEGRYDPAGLVTGMDVWPYAPGVNCFVQVGDTDSVRAKKHQRFYFMQGLFLMAAQAEGINIRQGIDWDMDNDFFDQKFDDLPHIELVLPRKRLWLPSDLLEEVNAALAAFPRGPLPPYNNPRLAA